MLTGRVKNPPSTMGEAVIMNRIFWWAYFGSRHEDIRVFQVEDLIDL